MPGPFLIQKIKTIGTNGNHGNDFAFLKPSRYIAWLSFFRKFFDGLIILALRINKPNLYARKVSQTAGTVHQLFGLFGSAI